MSEDLVKYGLAQGGAVLVLIVVLWSYRRDLAKKNQGEKDRSDQLLGVVEKSTAAITKNETTTARLARALERRQLVAHEDGDDA